MRVACAPGECIKVECGALEFAENRLGFMSIRLYVSYICQPGKIWHVPNELTKVNLLGLYSI